MNYWLGLDKLFFSLLRLLLRWMTRAATVPEALADLDLDPEQPVMFVLRESSLADLLVVEQEARRLGLHSPLHSLSLGNDQIRRGYFYMYDASVQLAASAPRRTAAVLMKCSRCSASSPTRMCSCCRCPCSGADARTRKTRSGASSLPTTGRRRVSSRNSSWSPCRAASCISSSASRCRCAS